MKPIFSRNARCRAAPIWAAICAVPMFELSFMISATEQGRLNGCVSLIEKRPTLNDAGQLYIWPIDRTTPESIAIATVNGLNVEPSS